MGIDVKFTDEDWERVGRAWSKWWDGELERPLVVIESANILIASMGRMTREFMLEAPVDQVLDFFQEKLEAIRYYGDAWPKWFPNLGPGAVAGFLGSNVTFKPEQRTVWYDVDESAPLPDLHFKCDPDNPHWRRARALTQGAVERWGDRVCVGHTDLGGNLDVLSSFTTANRLLVELIDQPDQVRRLGRELTDRWLRYYDELHEIVKPTGRGTCGWAEIWSPAGRTYMTQSDFSFMISPAMFERFVLPDLEACCARLDHGFYHLDGKGEIAHLDHLLAMKDLKGIQWIPGAGQPQPEEWMELLRRIRDGGKLCQVYVTAAGARRIVREIGGRGFVLYVAPYPAMSAEEAEAFLKLLAEEDKERK